MPSKTYWNTTAWFRNPAGLGLAGLELAEECSECCVICFVILRKESNGWEYIFALHDACALAHIHKHACKGSIGRIARLSVRVCAFAYIYAHACAWPKWGLADMAIPRHDLETQKRHDRPLACIDVTLVCAAWCVHWSELQTDTSWVSCLVKSSCQRAVTACRWCLCFVCCS